jgi:HlyD family secretion protein
MSANVDVIVGSLQSVLSLPTEAILKKESSNFVYIIHEGKARLQSVIVGESNSNLTEIREGVQEGELVILTPTAPGLKDGVRVKAVEVDTGS